MTHGRQDRWTSVRVRRITSYGATILGRRRTPILRSTVVRDVATWAFWIAVVVGITIVCLWQTHQLEK